MGVCQGASTCNDARQRLALSYRQADKIGSNVVVSESLSVKAKEDAASLFLPKRHRLGRVSFDLQKDEVTCLGKFRCRQLVPHPFGHEGSCYLAFGVQ